MSQESYFISLNSCHTVEGNDCSWQCVGKGWEYDTAQTNTGDLRHLMLNVENYAEKVALNLTLRWISFSSLLRDSNYYIYRQVQQTLGACGREALNNATAHSSTYCFTAYLSLFRQWRPIRLYLWMLVAHSIYSTFFWCLWVHITEPKENFVIVT